MAQNTTFFFDTEPSNESALNLMNITEDFNYKPPYSTTSLIVPNNGTTRELPIDMQFNDGHRLAITIYSLLMFFSAVGNIYVLSSITQLNRKGKLSRINLFLLHLTIADLLVTFLMMPLEIGWHYTVSWQAGDLMCRLMSFLRIFGLYLSGFVLVVISLDLFFAVVKPLGIAYADGRAKVMLVVAWIASLLFSLPQSIIFHVEKHPEFKWYEQCVTFNAFPSKEYEVAYNMFSFFFLYVFPLTMIIFCYSCILFKVFHANNTKSSDKQLRRSNTEALGRAKVRTLKTTVTIVATFFFCWTPYNIMSLWYWFDRKSAQAVDQRIQKGFFLFACTNSCLNPLIYGFFHFRRNQRQTDIPASRNNGKPIQNPGEKLETNVQWKESGCCRVTLEPLNRQAELCDASCLRVGNSTNLKYMQLRIKATNLDCETRHDSTRTSFISECSSDAFLKGLFAIKETQI